MDAELAKKQALKYDVVKEQEATRWMEQILGEKLQGRFQDFLKDGTVLCRVLNEIKPGTIRKIESSKCEAYASMLCLLACLLAFPSTGPAF